MASEEMKRRKREEYETQLFGIHSRAAYDATKYIIEDEIENLCCNLYKSIEQKYKPEPKERSVLVNDTKKLIQTYEKGAENHMKKLNDIVRKFIAVPDHLLLDEDKGQAVQVSQDELDERKWKIEDLCKRAKKASMFNAALRQELEIQQRFQVCEESINDCAKIIEYNKVIPSSSLESHIQKFTQESEELYNRMDVQETTNLKRSIYNPIIKDLKELDSVS